MSDKHERVNMELCVNVIKKCINFFFDAKRFVSSFFLNRGKGRRKKQNDSHSYSLVTSHKHVIMKILLVFVFVLWHHSSPFITIY